MRRFLRENGLSIIVLAAFLVIWLAGQTLTGLHTYNAEREQAGERELSIGQYVTSAHFGEATFENFESEFLQMACYVVLTAFLYQRGSSESKRPDVIELVDLDPRDSPQKDDAPWPVRRGGFILRLYENSLSLTFAALFLLSFAGHAWAGAVEYSADRVSHGQSPVTIPEYVASSQFWFESFQNWQSEFVSLALMVVLTIFLRQRGSPESKPVAAATWDTGA
jgi:hypothetical protein